MRTRCGARVVRRARCGDAPNRLLGPLVTQRQDEEARLTFGPGPGDVAQHSGDDGVAVPRVNHPSLGDRSLAAILVRLVRRVGDLEAEFGVGLQRRALAVQRARNMSAVANDEGRLLVQAVDVWIIEGASQEHAGLHVQVGLGELLERAIVAHDEQLVDRDAHVDEMREDGGRPTSLCARPRCS